MLGSSPNGERPRAERTHIRLLPRAGVLSAAAQTLLLRGPVTLPGTEGAGRPSHLVGRCCRLLGAHGILLVVGEHDQANEAAHAEHQLLAREDGIAGAARGRGREGLTDTLKHVPEPQKQTHIFPNGGL